MRKFRDGEMVRSITGAFPGVGFVLSPNRIDFPPHDGPEWPYAVIYVDEHKAQLMGKFTEDQLRPVKGKS